MKNIAITIFILLVAVILGLYLVSFQVREIESALVTTFGKPTRQLTEPGRLTPRADETLHGRDRTDARTTA